MHLRIGLGVVAGVLSGLFGVGGGIVLVPGLMLLGFDQHRAHATSLAAIILTATAGLLTFAQEGALEWIAGASLIIGAQVGAVAGAAAMRRAEGDTLRRAFAVLLLLVAGRMLLAPEGAAGPTPEVAVVTALALAGIGVVVGVLSALLGVGGGVVLVPVLALLFGFAQQVAAGTSLLVIAPTALTGALQHHRGGFTDWRTALVVGAGGVAGAPLGALAALSLPADMLQQIFAVLLIVLGLRMLLAEEPPAPLG